LTALHRASRLTHGDVKLKTRLQYVDADSDVIKSYTSDLRSVITQAELDEFRATHAQL